MLTLLLTAACGGRRVLVHQRVPAELKLGYLTVQHLAKEGLLRVLDHRQNRTLLRLNLADAFITLRRADDAVREKFASYKMHEVVRENCDLLQLLSAQVTQASIVLQGQMGCGTAVTGIDMVFIPEEGHVVLTLKPHDARFNRLRFRFVAEENEHVFGGGEQFTHLDLRGKRLPMLSEEQGIGRGAQPITLGANLTAGAGGSDVTTYAPVPFFFTSAYRSFETMQTAYQQWDFVGDEYTVEIWDNSLNLKLSTAGSYTGLISGYTTRTGRMKPLPEWMLGTILGVQGGRQKVEQVLDAALAAGNPVSAIWIQDWVGHRITSFGSQLPAVSAAELWWRWQSDEQSYPDFKNWVAKLAQRGVRVLGYINPFLADDGALFAEARTKGYLVRNRVGEPCKIQTAGFPAYLIDLSNPAARNFLKDIIRKNLLASGMAGYMADFGEWLPWDSVLASGETGAVWHNRYPVEWARLNREAIREAGLEGKVVFFTRAGFSGSAAYSTLFWEGDQMVTFDQYDGLASAITGLITGGVSGITLNHSDIGGYTTIDNPVKNYHRSRELLLRWAEFAVFTPVFRTHEGNRPEKNYQAYGDENIVLDFAALGRKHAALKPYFSTLMLEAEKRGLPLARPVFLHYPGDPNTFTLRHQFLLGRDVMVAPVTQPGASEGRVYLPADHWIESSTGKSISHPGWYSFTAIPGKPVAFIRENSPARELLLKALR